MATHEFRRERHSVTDLKIHLICITKYRRKVFTDEGLKCIEAAMRSVSDSMKFRILEFNGEGDHVHVLLEFPPKLSVSVLAKHLKGVSSRAYSKAGYPKPSTKTLWSPSYFATSVGGAPLEVVKQYIEGDRAQKQEAQFLVFFMVTGRLLWDWIMPLDGALMPCR